MRAKRIWTIQSFFTCFVWNAVLVGILYYVADQILRGLSQWVAPFVQPGGTELPADIRSAFVSLGELIRELQLYLAPAVFGTGGVITLILWLFILIQGRGLARRAVRESAVLPAPPVEQPEVKITKEKKVAEPPAPEPYIQPTPQAAVQMLSILQREGRLIDFLEEDLSLYDDAQIGAAVRNIHQGCKGALSEYVDLKPVFEEGEGVEVTVPAGFDSRAIRLTGNVAGDPPFKGVLRHRGWRVTRVELPQPLSEQKKDWIVAPAEVEVGMGNG